MKKKKIAFLLLACTLCLAPVGCKKADNPNKFYYEQVSEIRNTFMSGESEHFEIDVYGGERERPYKADGIAEKRVKYFLVIVYPKENPNGAEYTISFKTDKKYSARLIKNPCFDSYAFDFSQVNSIPDTIEMEVVGGTASEIVTVLNVAKNVIPYQNALDLAVEKYKVGKTEEELEADRVIGFEIAMRLVVNRKYSEKTLMWHFVLVKKDGTCFGTMFEAVKSTVPESYNPGEDIITD